MELSGFEAPGELEENRIGEERRFFSYFVKTAGGKVANSRLNAAGFVVAEVEVGPKIEVNDLLVVGPTGLWTFVGRSGCV